MVTGFSLCGDKIFLFFGEWWQKKNSPACSNSWFAQKRNSGIAIFAIQDSDLNKSAGMQLFTHGFRVAFLAPNPLPGTFCARNCDCFSYPGTFNGNFLHTIWKLFTHRFWVDFPALNPLPGTFCTPKSCFLTVQNTLLAAYFIEKQAIGDFLHTEFDGFSYLGSFDGNFLHMVWKLFTHGFWAAFPALNPFIHGFSILPLSVPCQNNNLLRFAGRCLHESWRKQKPQQLQLLGFRCVSLL